MKLTKHNFTISIVILAAMHANWGCKKDTAAAASTVPNAPVNTIKLASNAQFGNILTDSAGNTLYFFSPDANGSSACTGDCLVAWPAFHTSSVKLPDGLDASDFSSTTRGDGTKQTTYKGWPLYYFQNDTKSGDVNGDAIGSVWFVAKPDYTVMLANTQLVGQDGLQYNSQLQPGAGVTQYITDGNGRTLYSFSPDHSRQNTFTKSDFSNNAFWPIDTASAIGKIPSTLDRAAFDTLTVFGKIQLVYKGWPLYYFGNDGGVRGSTKGVSVPAPGIWPVVNGTSAAAPL